MSYDYLRINILPLFSEIAISPDNITVENLKTILNGSRTNDLSDILKLYQPSKNDVNKHSQDIQKLIVSCSFDSEPCSFK